jgi:hypothetical protein
MNALRQLRVRTCAQRFAHCRFGYGHAAPVCLSLRNRAGRGRQTIRFGYEGAD